MKKAIIQYLEQLQISGITEIPKTNRKSTNSINSAIAFVDKAEALAEKFEQYKDCQKCQLWTGRNKFVYGVGNPDATCMVIGEGPGAQENIQGKPFVGEAGHLLDKMLLAIQIKREDVYIANIVKCRPPNNRDPEQEERLACLPYLMEQIDIIQPKIFLLMGRVAAQTLLQTTKTMKVLREKPHEFLGRPAYVTYHPAALLRNPEWKKEAWIDLQIFQKVYEKLLQG